MDENEHGAEVADSIPDTPIFDRARSLRGYKLNKMAMSLGTAAHRVAFKSDEAGYMRSFGLSDIEVEAVLARDWRELVRLGGNIFFLLKITASDDKPLPLTVIGAHQTSMDHADFLRNRLGKK